jgi:OPT family oligopeptide transporter
MAPDRGTRGTGSAYQSTLNLVDSNTNEEQRANDESLQCSNGVCRSSNVYTNGGQNFTVRGIMVGLAVGLIICFSNTFFGLQTGWVSSMSMPSSLIGFAFFKTLSGRLELPFSPVENVLVQTVAGSMGTMPLGCGFVGVIPALNYMLKPDEGGPIFLSLWKLTLWALGLCYFGVVFAVPLRRQVIIREKLKFPSGTATALMIGVLHQGNEVLPVERSGGIHEWDEDGRNPLEPISSSAAGPSIASSYFEPDRDIEGVEAEKQSTSWNDKVRLLAFSFMVSSLYALATYFFPILRNLPIFGVGIAQYWLWTLNPSLAYVGQGIIMGPATTMHMLIGTIIGWGILSPLAKLQGWAPGPIDNWETGSKGWIVWISLAIMLSDSVVSLGYLSCRSLLVLTRPYIKHLQKTLSGRGRWSMFKIGTQSILGYARINEQSEVPTSALTPEIREPLDETTFQRASDGEVKDPLDTDVPTEHLVSETVVWASLAISIICCIVCIRIAFGALVPLYATITAVIMALVLSIAGVRALGETDLNPVSGISKIAQLFFALIVPQSNKNSVLINLVAGAVSEAGALQAGDLMQDLKTGHLLGAAPNAQFWGQIIGSTVGAVASAMIYKLYTSVYTVPGDLFQVPTGYVWIFTARLVTGKGLPPFAAQWALGAAVIFAVTTSIRIAGNGKWWHPYIPGGIAVAVGKLGTKTSEWVALTQSIRNV